jgi:hypothetical protein
MQQNQDNISCVGKFVRTFVVHAPQSGRPEIRKNPLHNERPHIHLPQNQESAQIPGFWNPMVNLKGVVGFFSDHKSSSAGSIPVSPNRHGSTREQIIPPESVRACKLIRMTGVKSIDRWAKQPSPEGFIYRSQSAKIRTFPPTWRDI